MKTRNLKEKSENGLMGKDAGIVESTELNRLVEATRVLDHPRLSTSRAKHQLHKVLSLWDDQKEKRLTKWDDQVNKYPSQKEPKVKFQFAPIFAVLAIILISVLVLNVIDRSEATSVGLTGLVMVSDAGEEWTQLETGAKLVQGNWVRTFADSSVTLAFEDGSRILIGPQSEIEIAKLKSNSDGLIQLELIQSSGETRNWVVPFSKPSSFYRIETAAGIAEVHGTIFEILINEKNVRFSVESGEVLVENEEDDEILTSGQTATSEEGEDITEPEFEFALQGTVIEMGTSEWVVAGVRFFVDTNTVINGSPEVGSLVIVRGRILSDGSRIADLIEMTLRDKERASFSGLVESINTESWVIGGQTILVNSETEIRTDLEVGMAVKVHFIVLDDGSWLAKEIESLDDREEEEPEDDSANELKGVCSHEKQHPVGLKLAEKYQVSYEEIMGWFCQNYGFGEIDMAYEMSQQTGISVEELFAMKAGGSGWGNIRKAVITRTPKPTREPKATKEPKSTKTPRPTREPKPTKEPKPTRIPKPTKEPRIKP